MENQITFDEKAMQGLDLLFHHFWILRSEQPNWYQLIREREKVLRRYLDDKFGLRLIVHQHFIKLEKIPVEPERWMGIQEFTETMDYAIFCCALAYIEGKSVDEQFLLSELCTEIQGDYPSDSPLDWTLYTHRKSLIRAMKALLELKLIRTIDGDLHRFDHHEEQEVLYEATIHSKYFIRSFPNDLTEFNSWNEILEADWKLNQEDERRKRVYRRLFFSPGIQRKDPQDPDFLYIRNFRNRLAEDIEKHSDYQLHVYKNTVFLSTSEPKMYHRLFPTSKASTDILLQLSLYIREHNETFVPNEKGEVVLTESEFEAAIHELRKRYEKGWSKYFREKSTSAIREELVEEMKDWMMLELDGESAFLYIKPLFAVLAGTFPADFQGGADL